MTPEQRALLERRAQLEAEGHPAPRKALAEEFGLTPKAVKNRLDRARIARDRDRMRDLDEGIQAGLQKAGLATTEGLAGGWLFPTDADGKKIASLRFAVPSDEASPEDISDRIKASLADLPAVEPSAPPLHTEGDLLGLVPVSDLHVGLMAWGRETGEDWSTQDACERLVKWSGQVIRSMPRCGVCVLLFNGDTLHADDQRNVTPVSKHQLDVDTRHFRTVDMAVQAIAIAADTARQWHGHVVLAIKRGNHDEHSYLALLFAMAQRYRLDSRVTVVKDPSEFWHYEFGKVLLIAHHGDKAKPEHLVMNLANEYAESWGRTRYRYLWTGHLHHLKSADIGGVQWEQSRAMAARDAYASARMYPMRAELQGVVYHYDKGEVARVRVAA